MLCIPDKLGGTVILDDVALVNSVGGHALRVTPSGSLEVLMMSPEERGWFPIEELNLVQVTGKQVKRN